MVTTNYGTWQNHGHTFESTPEDSVLTAISGGDSEWREKMDSSGAFGRLCADYRQAVNEALAPYGIALAGDQFIGPYYSDPAYVEMPEGKSIASIIDAIDLNEIIERRAV